MDTRAEIAAVAALLRNDAAPCFVIAREPELHSNSGERGNLNVSDIISTNSIDGLGPEQRL